jgi:GNAT superfamily N-acetyltransferase
LGAGGREFESRHPDREQPAQPRFGSAAEGAVQAGTKTTPKLAAMLITRGGYEIDDDPGRLDVDAIHAFLARDAYWSAGIPRDVLSRAIAGSLNFGLYGNGAQVGFARVVSDKATFAWLCDVYVLPDHRGHGLGHWLVRAALDHPDLQGLRRIMLATSDAHRIYADCGFAPLSDPQRWMAIATPAEDLYRAVHHQG